MYKKFDFNFIIYFFIVIYFFIFIYIIIKITTEQSIIDNNLKIINLNLTGSDYVTMMRNLHSVFDNIFMVTGSYSFDNHERHPIKLLQTKKTINEIPFLSPNINSVDIKTVEFIPGYKSLLNNTGDFVFLSDGYDHIDWNSNNDYIKSRNEETTFLIDNESDYEEKTHYSRIIITRYLYNSQKAVHFNYIVKKKGVSKNETIAFIKFINYVNKFIQDEKIFYFSVSGITNLSSAKWHKIINIVFKESCYVSPGITSDFITSVDAKKGVRSNRFIFVSRKLAPFGVYFYLTEQKIDLISSSNILVAEILSSKKKYTSKNDDTKKIYNKFLKQKLLIPSLKQDLENFNDVDIHSFKLNEIGNYDHIAKKKLNILTL